MRYTTNLCDDVQLYVFMCTHKIKIMHIDNQIVKGHLCMHVTLDQQGKEMQKLISKGKTL